MKKFLYWSPRILAILFTAFIVICIFYVTYFIFYVLGLEFTLKGKLKIFFFSLALILTLIVSIIIAWKKELIGGCLFLVAGLNIMVYLRLGSYPIGYFLLTVFPLYLIGILFIINSKALREFCKKLSV